MSPKPTAAPSGRLTELIRQAERGEIDPRKAAACALSIARSALKHVRCGVSNAGQEYSYDDPKHEAALKGLEAALRIAKVLGDKPGAVSAVPEDFDALLEVAKRELNARGYEVVARGARQ